VLIHFPSIDFAIEIVMALSQLPKYIFPMTEPSEKNIGSSTSKIISNPAFESISVMKTFPLSISVFVALHRNF
jgi:hypothetical protein